MNKRRTREAAGLALFFLSLIFFGAAVLVWFTGAHKWHVLGIKISVSEWRKAWWEGTALLVFAFALSEKPGGLLTWILAPLMSLCEKAGLGVQKPGKNWAAGGMFLGGVAGALFSIHYYYLVPRLAFQVLSVICAALFSSLVHWFFFAGTEALQRMLARVSRPLPVHGFRPGLYALLWSLLVTGPLVRWEARATEPAAVQVVFAGLVSGVLVWLLLADWRAPGAFGWVRRLALPAAGVVVLALSAWSWSRENAKARPGRPPRDRVLFITLDTTRADYLSCYGYPRKTSPALDRLAQEGALFTRAYCNMGITDPSHATMFTGFYPRSHGLAGFHQEIAAGVPSLGELFLDRGYATGAVASREHLQPSQLNIPGFQKESGPAVWMKQTSAAEAFRRAANFLYRHRDENIFLWVHFFDPHHPYQPHSGPGSQFVKEDKGAKGGKGWLKPGARYSEDELQYRRDLYAGEIRYMDYWVGKLIQLVKNLEPRPEREPFIIAVGDHGEALGEYQDRPEHYAFGHGPVLYEPVVRVPLIISWPGVIPQGKRIPEIVETVDLASTLADYLLQEDFPGQGESLRPVIQKGAPTDGQAVILRLPENSPYFPEAPLPEYALVQDSFKLLLYNSKPLELYDLEKDQEEEQNLVSQNPELARKLAADWEKWLKNTPHAWTQKKQLSPGERRALKALGYLQ